MTTAAESPGDRPRRTRSKLEHFEVYRRAADMPNAIATLDDVADELHARLCVEHPLRTDLPSIVSSFMPKSGGTFLHNRLVRDCGYAVYHWGVPHPQAAQAVYAVPRALRNFLRGGCTSHTHALPTPHNLAVFRQERVPAVWVHVRHPCEVVQSAFFHYAGEGQGEGVVGHMRAVENAAEAERLGFRIDRSEPSSLNEFFRTQLSWVIDWLRMWVHIDEAIPGFVHFTFYRELSDPVRLLQSVFDRFAVPIEVKAVHDHLPEDRRRHGHSPDWREGLTIETIGEAVALIEDRLAPPRWLRERCGIDG